MSELNSADYYRGREEQERALAARAVDPGIAAIHADMADRYSELRGQAVTHPPTRSKLHLVA